MLSYSDHDYDPCDAEKELRKWLRADPAMRVPGEALRGVQAE